MKEFVDVESRDIGGNIDREEKHSADRMTLATGSRESEAWKRTIGQTE